MKKIFHLLLCSVFVLTGCTASETKPIKALVLTGQNNHNWPVSHVAIQRTLENSGLFDVDVLISPKEGEDMSSFIVDFTPYEVVVLDYTGDDWPSQTRSNFLDYVQGGGGVVIYHAANNAFTDWKAYNEIIALGGWGGRTEASGPYVYLKDGKLFKDNSPGNGGNHGAQHEFVMEGFGAEHPVTKGLPKDWMHATDELYELMRGPGNIQTLLYSAYSSPDIGGAGRQEPLVFTVDYGKARIFHLMLGHAGPNLENNPAMQCTGFQVMLLRGAEWAATGQVKQDVPADFPTADKVSMRSSYKEN